MTSLVRTRLLTFLAGLVIVPAGTALVIMFARGYRPNLQQGTITATGILSAHTYPEAAQIYIDGAKTSHISNANLNLEPGEYQLEYKKEGYTGWKKTVRIEKEIVTQATAVLFPEVPTLKSVNLHPATRVTLSPDATRIVYLSAGNQIYTLDLNESPLGIFNRDARLIGTLPARLSPDNLQLNWSPDSRQILIREKVKTASVSAYLIDPGLPRISPAGNSVSLLLQDWDTREAARFRQKLESLPPLLQPVLATASANLVWSPRENKLLYTATASAILPNRVITPLPGSSTQPQNRQLTPGGVYVYDLEEDRNFMIDSAPVITPSPTPKSNPKLKTNDQMIKWSNDKINGGWSWFPTSSHLYRVSSDLVTVIEYDGQNQTVIYAGPLFESTALPYPSGKLMLLLTKFPTTPAASASASPSLYALTLR